MDLYTFLIVSHLVGTVLGVGGATFAEIFYTRALKDGGVSPEEGATLKTIYRVLRIGLVLTVLSGFGFLLLFRLTGMEERLFDPKLWAKMTIIGVLLVNALLLQAHRIPMWLGASLSLTSWYAAMIIGAWRGIPYSYWEILFGYGVAVVLVALGLEVFKKWYFKQVQHE
jgi:Cu/Ag efflux pump CusA